jgi:hypothetical protein
MEVEMQTDQMALMIELSQQLATALAPGVRIAAETAFVRTSALQLHSGNYSAMIERLPECGTEPITCRLVPLSFLGSQILLTGQELLNSPLSIGCRMRFRFARGLDLPTEIIGDDLRTQQYHLTTLGYIPALTMIHIDTLWYKIPSTKTGGRTNDLVQFASLIFAIVEFASVCGVAIIAQHSREHGIIGSLNQLYPVHPYMIRQVLPKHVISIDPNAIEPKLVVGYKPR